MTFIPVPRGVQLCFNFVTGGQAWQFCIQLQKTAGSVTVTDLENVRDDAATWWTSDLKALMHPSTQGTNITATDMTTQGGPISTLVTGHLGTASGTALPNNAAVVVSHRTDLRGRSYRGRSYVGGLASSALSTATEIASGFITSLGAAFIDLAAAELVNGFEHVIASRQHNGVATNPAVVHPVTAYIIDTHFDAQRRRLFGRGT